MSIASGSTGNCYYLGNNEQGILIDAGIPIKEIRNELRKQNIDIEQHIMGVLITHDHTDHVRSVAHLANRYNLPLFAAEQVYDGMKKNKYLPVIEIASNKRIVIPQESFSLAGFEITAFEVPHDSTFNVGYYITNPESSLHFTLITDVGHITPEIAHYAGKASHLVLEANYETEMLRTGKYPPFLKARVAGPLGHLSNQDSVEFLCSVYHGKMRNVWLCHLSKENNHPELCRKVFDIRLFNEGIRVGKDLFLEVLRRNVPSEMYILEE